MPVNHQQIKWITLVLLAILIVIDLIRGLPFWVYAIPLLTYLIPVNYGSARIHSQFFVPAMCQGHTSEKQIALTFDDGPTAYTPAVLDLLKEHEMPATFFCIGKQVRQFPETLARIEKEGHLIGNHSFTHSYSMGFFPARRVRSELLQTDESIKAVTGRKVRWFRPPFGVTNPMIAAALKKTGHTVIGWNVRSLDTVTKDSPKVVKRVMKQLKPGAIVLLHDRHERIVPVLRQLLPQIKASGYAVVPLNQLLNIEVYESA